MLKKVQEQVAWELQRSQKCCDDDFYLIACVYKDFYNVGFKDSFLEVMLEHKFLGLPSFESIRRSRQKLQEMYPKKYASTKQIEKLRKESEYDFYEWAKQMPDEPDDWLIRERG